MDHHQMNENVYQGADSDEKQAHPMMGGRKNDDGSSSESDLEYITEDSLLCILLLLKCDTLNSLF